MKKLIVPIVKFAATCLLAHGAWAADAIWIGGESGYMNDVANWSSDITASGAKIMFTNDCTVSLSADLAVNSVFTDNTKGSDFTGRFDKSVTINLNGRTLRSNGTENSGNHYWRARGSTLTFTGGTFENVQDGGTTNSIVADNAGLSYDMSLIVTGSGTKFVSSFVNRALNDSKLGTRFILKDGASAFGGTFAFGDTYSTNKIQNATLTFANNLLVGAVGSAEGSHGNNYGIHDTALTISGSTVTSENGWLSVGHGFNKDKVGYANGSRNNSLVVEKGSTVSVNNLQVGTYGANSNNTMIVKGQGTTLSVTGQTRVGAGNANSVACGVCRDNSLVITDGARATFSGDHVYVPISSGAAGNRFVVSNGAYALVEKSVILGMYGTNNTVVVSSGATLESAKSSILYFGHEGSGYGARLEINGGHVSFTNQIAIGQANYEGAHEVFVGNGGTLFSKTITFRGVGDKLVVSNGTVTTTTFNVGQGEGASGTVVKVMGESALVSFETWLNQEEYPHGAPVFEFVIPEGGWALAPIRSNRAFSLPENVTLRIDAESVAAYLKANPRGGTIPLMRTGDSSRAITVADMDALSANLPDGCSLANESGVLSLKIKSTLGFMVIVL